MFNEVEGLIQRVSTGEIDRSSVSQAANEHVASMDPSQLTQKLQTAAGNAGQNGQNDIASQIMTLVTQNGSNPEALKQGAIALITSNPQILQHFEPGFVQAIAGRL